MPIRFVRHDGSCFRFCFLAVLQGREIAQLRKVRRAQSAVSLNLTAELMRLYGYDESIIGPLFRAATAAPNRGWPRAPDCLPDLALRSLATPRRRVTR